MIANVTVLLAVTVLHLETVYNDLRTQYVRMVNVYVNNIGLVLTA